MSRKIKKYSFVLMSIVFLTLNYGCDKFLEVQSLTKIEASKLVSNEDGIKTLVSNMYNGLPMEDFCYRPNAGFNRRGWQGGAGEMTDPSFQTDEAIKSDGGEAVALGSLNIWSQGFTGDNIYQINAWDRNRQVSIFLKNIETAKDNGDITAAVYNRLWSEAHFARAYIYFALAKRFGGVPIIDKIQDDDYVDGNPEPLKVPRSTELDTWKFILDCCDKAAQYLPKPEDFKSTDGDSRYRATKWAAYALKSRAALHAASLAKYGDKVPFTGKAVEQKLVGISATDANFFYGECISACDQIIKNSGHTLYKPSPANPAEAASNYQNIFLTIPEDEVIFARSYLDGSKYADQGHSFDIYFSPAQVATGFHKWGRFSPTLELVDAYEDYTDNGSGASAKIVTRTDGNEDFSFPTNTPSASDVAAVPFVKYDNPYEPFKNKDARLHGSIIVPGAKFKGVTIIMQGGMIRKDGSLAIYEEANAVGDDGVTYYSFGASAPSLYGAFRTMTSADDANWSCTGFSVRKFLAENGSVNGVDRSSSTPWIDFRLAEIYLNYAEAVVESGTGSNADAATYINALRQRAGHSDQIPLTLDNVRKERRVEMAFEHNRVWDLFRLRDYHLLYQNYRRKSLVQLVDLRENPPKYVFLRIDNFQDVRNGGRTFQTMNYYQDIPGRDVNGLVNNPGRGE